ncbi:MAG: ABC transporter substrate-binding protein [Hyphomicrobiales bacterium]|nr:ABC transporter substrate-binding protein [Hyphomicrobiales bacterium]
MKFPPVIAAALATSLVLAGAAAAQTAPPLEINYGYPTVDHVNIYVAQDLGLFEKAGLKPKFFTFQSGAPLIAALKSESLDVATAGLGLAFAIGQGIPLKFVLWNSNDATGEALVVDKDSPIKSYVDIVKAKKIGAASGTCAQVALYLMAQKVGVDYAKLDVVNIPAPLLRNAFLSKSIDAGIAWAPYSITLDQEGFHAVNWDPDYTPLGGVCPRITAVRSAFLAAHPEVGAKLVEIDAAAAAAITKNPKLAVDAVDKRLGLTEDVARASIARVYDKRPTYAQQIDPASPYSLTAKDGGLAKSLFLATQALYATRSIPEPIALSKIQDSIDPSFVAAFAEKSKR